MITLTKAPPVLCFSRNPIELAFQTDAKYTSAGTMHLMFLSFSVFPADDDDKMTAKYTKDGEAVEIEFTFKTTPDASMYQIEKYGGSDAAGWLLNKLLPGLRAHPRLAEDFTMALRDDSPFLGLQLRATFYDDSSTAWTGDGCTPVCIFSIAGSIPAAQTNYRLGAQVYVSNSNIADSVEYSRAPVIEKDADQQSKVRVNMQSYVGDFLSTPEARPTDALTLCSSIARWAYVTYHEKYGDPLEKYKGGTTALFRVLNGRVSDNTWTAKKAALGEWLTARFMTDRTEQRVPIDFTVYLFWYCHATSAAMKVLALTTWTDGTVTSKDVTTAGSVVAGEVYKIGVTKAKAVGVGPVSQSVVSVSLSIVYDTTPVTNSIMLRQEEHWLDVMFEYENAYGALELWLFRGSRTEKHHIEKEAYTVEMPFDAAAGTGRMKAYAERETVNLECNTGPMSAIDAKAFPQFLMSRNVKMKYEGVWQEVRILNADAIAQSYTDDGDYARPHNFTVQIVTTPY